jgi:malate dehydrogenase (oxaloacetate-decarboxylating)(NADP+)
MAIYAANAMRVTDEIFIEAASAVAEQQVTPERSGLWIRSLLQSNVLEAKTRQPRVAKLILDSGFAGAERLADLVACIPKDVSRLEYANETNAIGTTARD